MFRHALPTHLIIDFHPKYTHYHVKLSFTGNLNLYPTRQNMTTFDDILDIAGRQHGYVANYQVDVSRQMFSHYASSGRLERVYRGIYRVSHFPTSENEEFIVAYLWSRERGVLSHESALFIHDLSDVLPRATHLTYPPENSLPDGPPDWLQLHRSDVPERHRQWYDIVPVTTPSRTLLDLAARGFSPDRYRQALDEAHSRGLIADDFERTIIFELMGRRANR